MQWEVKIRIPQRRRGRGDFAEKRRPRALPQTQDPRAKSARGAPGKNQEQPKNARLKPVLPVAQRFCGGLVWDKMAGEGLVRWAH